MTIDDPVYVEVCAGIGGLSIGLELAGWRPICFVENKPFCKTILARHYPEVPCLDDLTDPNIHHWIREAIGDGVRVDLLCGGIPCQPVSHAGRRKGAADDRFLWPYMLGLIRELRPRFVLVENVYGLVTAERGLVIEGVYADLEGAGYETAEPVVFPAAAVGAPHRRDRVWIVAADGQSWDAAATYPDDARRAWDPGRGGQTARDDGWGRRPVSAVGGIEGREVWPDTDPTGRGLEEWDGLRPDRERSLAAIASPEWWALEPEVGRVVDGSPGRVGELEALGNGVVPQQAWRVGVALLDSWRANE